jgi:hypothetical protein
MGSRAGGLGVMAAATSSLMLATSVCKPIRHLAPTHTPAPLSLSTLSSIKKNTKIVFCLGFQ